MPASETELIVLAVDGNVIHVLLRELLNGLFDGLNTALLAHGLGGVVRVASCTVPVARLEGLGMERYLDTPLFGHTDEEEAGHPKVVTHRDTLTGTNLELPLRGHDLGVDTRDVDTSVEACAVMGLDQITSEDPASAYNETRGVRHEGGVGKKFTYQHRSNKDPGDPGSLPWANRMACRPNRRGYTPVQGRTTAPVP